VKLETKVIVEYVEKNLSKERIAHSKRVADFGQNLAFRHGLNVEKAYIAGILHDVARELKKEMLLKKAMEYDFILNIVERHQPELLHGPVGAKMVEEELGLNDKEILSAIFRHTLGDPSMTPLDEVIFLADMLEQKREFPGVENLRQLAFNSLEKAMLEALKESLIYVAKRNILIHPRTVETFNSFLLKLK